MKWALRACLLLPVSRAHCLSNESVVIRDSPQGSLAIHVRRLHKLGCKRLFKLSLYSVYSLTDTQALQGRTLGESRASAERNVSLSGKDDGLTAGCFEPLIS